MNGYFTCYKLSKFSKMCFTTTKETALAPFNLAHSVDVWHYARMTVNETGKLQNARWDCDESDSIPRARTAPHFVFPPPNPWLSVLRMFSHIFISQPWHVCQGTSIHQQLEQYMAELCFYTGASLHQFWIQHQAVCPPLASLALAMLSAPASSAYMECTF